MVATDDLNLTPRAKTAYKLAKSFATENEHSIVNNAHVLYGCLMHCSEDFWKKLKSEGISFSLEGYLPMFAEFAQKTPELFNSSENNDFKNPVWGKDVNEALGAAKEFSEMNEKFYIGVEHIVYCIFLYSEELMNFLFSQKVDTEHFLVVLADFFIEDEEFKQEVEDGIPATNNTSPAPNLAAKATKFSSFCTDLTAQARRGELGLVTGREEEIDQLVEILSKKTKSNAMLLGEAGVGKTAIVEGLAQRIARKHVPPHLVDSSVCLVDVAAMVAGAKFRGEFEKKFKALLDASSEIGGVILFFDEIHTIVGAGSAEGSMDAANMLKPTLARGGFQCIGATTSLEYKKYFEKDEAIKRRFDTINIEEPSLDATKSIVKNAIPYYEAFHYIHYPSEMVAATVDLCAKYLPDKRFPDKAFDVIDQVCARVKIKETSLPAELQARLDAILQKRFDNSLKPPSEESKKAFDEEAEAFNKDVSLFSEAVCGKPFEITEDNIIQVVAKKAGIAPDCVSSGAGSFVDFSNKMKRELFGQDKEIDSITSILACSKIGLNDPDKPLASFAFVGPTSVGKTFAAKLVAKYFFGNEKACLMLNMSEFQERASLSKLIGANAGYVGYENGGILTDFVRKNPNSVLIFDEIEKCEPQILNLLINLLDEGYITDTHHRKVDCSQTVVVLTSNAGQRKIGAESIGFNPEILGGKQDYLQELSEFIRPELAARINKTIVFNRLSNEDLKKIVSVEVGRVQSRLAAKNKELKIDDGVIDWLFQRVSDQKFHARLIKDLVKSQIQIPVALFCLAGEEKSRVFAKIVDNRLNLE